MLNSFFGLEMGKRALNAFRQGIEVAGHNTSNVKTKGYSRQRVDLSTTDPYTDPGLTRPATPGQIGTGVKVDEIIRIRDEFLDFQFRSEQAALGYWDKINKLYDSLQLYIAEPNKKGVRDAMDTFFTSMQSLQKDPDSAAVRESVIQSAKTLGSELNRIISGYDSTAVQFNDEVKTSVDQINIKLHKIAALNKQIYQLKAMGQNPNDLLDTRDLLLDELSGMIDITIQEPQKQGDITGEFFLTLNGRTLIQGTKVRELVAHAFQWENKTYYDVQVKDNEFDIVENCMIASALATGPEGVHMLKVDRLANGEPWTIGGDDPYCLEPDGTIKSVPVNDMSSKVFAGGVVLSGGVAGDVHHLVFRSVTTDGNPYDLTVTLTWDDTNSRWQMSNSLDLAITSTSAGTDLTVAELDAYLTNVFAATPDTLPAENSGLTASLSAGNVLTVTSGAHNVNIYDSGNILGIQKQLIPMRLRPVTTTEALNTSGSFRIQVGSQGTQAASKIFRNENHPDLVSGDIMGRGSAGESYTFRVGAHTTQADITVTWHEDIINPADSRWQMTSDVFANAGGTSIMPLPATYPVPSAAAKLTVNDLTAFLKQALPQSGNEAFVINSGSTDGSINHNQFAIASGQSWLVSVSDVKGDLASRMGLANPNPVIEIDVAEADSLEVIRNKINEKYQAEFGLVNPEQWVHASLKQDEDQSWYLTMEANVSGEAQRIALLPGSDGNSQVLRRLGLLKLEQIGTTAAAAGSQPIYREVAALSGVAEDASFTFNNVRYLSSDNKFSMARRVPGGADHNDYSAKELTEVSKGIWLELKGVGRTAIRVEHHVKGGSVKALEEARDKVIPDMKAYLDELAWTLTKNVNALQYSGYGVGNDITTTGTAFFNPLKYKADAGKLFKVNERVADSVSLIGAAMGQFDADGRAAYGKSNGAGDGKNASRLSALKESKLLTSGSATFAQFYEGFISKIGSEAARAELMFKAQSGLSEQIDTQRQSVMGVNMDEEILDIMMFNQAFNAMSRYATTIDEMLDRLINGFGLVGR